MSQRSRMRPKFSVFPTHDPNDAAEARAMIAHGEKLAAGAEECDYLEKLERLKRADSFIKRGQAYLATPETMVPVAGGEMVTVAPTDPSLPPEDWSPQEEAEWLIDRTKNPDRVAAQASHDRLNLADQSGCAVLALDASDSVKGANSLEKMLIHQMAAIHRHAMKMTARIEEATNPDEIVKLVGAATRLMGAFQNGFLTLSKVRTGGKQQVVVQHVNVTGDAQAVVAGQMGYPQGGRACGGGGNGK